MMRRLINWLTALTFLIASSGTLIFFLFFYYGRGLPDYDFLHNYEPLALNRIEASNGQVLREFSQERRIYVPLDQIPSMIINSFLVAEDKNFFYHCGLDIHGIMRAIIANSLQGSWQSRPLGGSTITQQVAKNFLIGNERTFERKAKEAIMSLRLESALSKERILELYLNQIYLGMGAYGIAAAAKTYFDKPLNKLFIEEIAFLAAMPKAPSFYPNQKDLTRAKARRDWVLDRLYEEGFLTRRDADDAKAKPLEIHHKEDGKAQPDYYTEHIRREILTQLGEDFITHGGLTIQTTLNLELQQYAKNALREGLIAYDRRHGWRGPLDHIDLTPEMEWKALLEKFPSPPGMGDWSLAIVLETTPDNAKIGLKDGEQGVIPLEQLTWAQKTLPNQTLGPEIDKPEDVVKPGDIIAVSHQTDQSYCLEQIPDVTGGLVALDPQTGHVLAMAGGYDFEKSQYNCVTQAKRQPGSAFKPIVYLTALEQGYTPETRILDAPVMINVGGKLGVYAPKNINNKFYGPTPLRSGLIYSRNVMTIRLAQQIGMKKIDKTARAFGLVDALPHQLAMALGAAETTLLKLTITYGMIANGGYHFSPIFIKQITNRHREIVYEASTPDKIRVASAKSIRQLIAMMKGVIQHGTARRLLKLGHPLAGKTGTTNDYKDAWFVGFTPNLVVGVFVGFASPRTLGPDETGSKVAVPIFERFMDKALKDKPILDFSLSEEKTLKTAPDPLEVTMISGELD